MKKPNTWEEELEMLVKLRIPKNAKPIEPIFPEDPHERVKELKRIILDSQDRLKIFKFLASASKKKGDIPRSHIRRVTNVDVC